MFVFRSIVPWNTLATLLTLAGSFYLGRPDGLDVVCGRLARDQSNSMILLWWVPSQGRSTVMIQGREVIPPNRLMTRNRGGGYKTSFKGFKGLE
jgi:hypothetical protein